jgi:16S rRNA (uracil1498-N3)-methyltransferase
MSRYDFRTPRLFVEAPLLANARVVLTQTQAHYLRTVMRLKPGAPVLAFNGRDGEWGTSLVPDGRRDAALAVEAQLRGQTDPSEVHYLFAPLKQARLDYLVQKAVEMGAARLVPVLTRHTQIARLNPERMRANSIEAAEQCGILTVPEIDAPAPLVQVLASRATARWLVFCDEDADVRDPVVALRQVLAANAAERPLCDVLIGPEGGFAEEERALLLQQPNVTRLALGPRILRADTAAVAALSLVQAVLGDWR